MKLVNLDTIVTVDYIHFTLKVAVTSFDTDVITSTLRYKTEDAHRVLTYDNPELAGSPYTAWTFYNTFWYLDDAGVYKFEEYFENIPLVHTLIAEISKIVQDSSFEQISEVKFFDLMRLISALELFWD